MGFMQKALAKITTKYGTVTNGRYEGYEIAFGSDPNKKVEVGAKPEQILFIDGTEEKGRLNIDSEIALIHVYEETAEAVRIGIVWSDKEVSIARITFKKPDLGVKKLLMTMGGGGKPRSEADQLRDKYGLVYNFFSYTLAKLSPDSLRWYADFGLRVEMMTEEFAEKLNAIADKYAPQEEDTEDEE